MRSGLRTVVTQYKTAMASDTSTNGPSLLLFGLLPSLLLQKIPRKLRSHSISASPATCPSRPISQASLDSITPPPSYQSNAEDFDSSDERNPIFQSFPMSGSSSRPSSSGSTTPMNSPPAESKSGIQWKYANTGFALLSLTAQEDSNASASSTRLTRRGYIDGVACMLRGLPPELTEEEELSIREALPASVDLAGLGEEQVVVRQGSRAGRKPNRPRKRQSTLHRCIAGITLYMFLAVSFILPYLQLLLRQAYQFDRRHKISDRVLAQSVIAADVMSKRTITVASNICAMNDGKVGDSMKEIGMYVVQGFSGGVYEGLGEGMQVLGLRNADSIPSRSAGSLEVR